MLTQAFYNQLTVNAVKIYYEKYDDTVQYLGTDKVPGWQPSKEDVLVEILDKELTLTTRYKDGFTTSKTMSIVENFNGRLIAQHVDENMGVTLFVSNALESDEATLTLINNDYIVSRYLREVPAFPEIID